MSLIVRLKVLTGPHRGSKFCFRNSNPTTIGRSHDCAICLCGEQRDLSISRRHCELTFDPPLLCVEDLNSSNGTYINGHHCQQFTVDALKNDDILTVGGTSFQVNIVDCQEWHTEDGIRHNCPTAC